MKIRNFGFRAENKIGRELTEECERNGDGKMEFRKMEIQVERNSDREREEGCERLSGAARRRVGIPG